MTRSSAKLRYIPTLIATMQAYASGTPEARELVAELEFVWDQVRANSNYNNQRNDDNDSNTNDHASDLPTEGPSRQSRRTRSANRDSLSPAPPRLRILRPSSTPSPSPSRSRARISPLLRSASAASSPDTSSRATSDNERALLPSHNPAHTWQARVDRALVQMTAEIAALREVVAESRGGGGRAGYRHGGGGRERGRYGWVVWLGWGLVRLMRRAVVDAIFVGVFVVGLRAWRGGWEEVRGWGEWVRWVMRAVRVWVRKVAGRNGVGKGGSGGLGG